mmetsp:Transcript_37508/g.90976  ORF Transcript_37508/g.90976 Transcript_37508/m.90976 type:complete len:88 (-) Transcript_37508:3052-3315(-)
MTHQRFTKKYNVGFHVASTVFALWYGSFLYNGVFDSIGISLCSAFDARGYTTVSILKQKKYRHLKDQLVLTGTKMTMALLSGEEPLV